MASFDNASQRPILPSLHTLNLLPFVSTSRLQGKHMAHDSYDNSSCLRPNFNWQHARHASSSSSMTSRSPSPTLSNSGSDASSSSSSSSSPSFVHHSPSPPPPVPSAKIRLVPCTMEDADAVVLVNPPNTPYVPTLSQPAVPEPGKQGQALLLVGPALQHLRHPERKLAKGARLHPYKIVRDGSSRRTSICSTTSSRFSV